MDCDEVGVKVRVFANVRLVQIDSGVYEALKHRQDNIVVMNGVLHGKL